MTVMKQVIYFVYGLQSGKCWVLNTFMYKIEQVMFILAPGWHTNENPYFC